MIADFNLLLEETAKMFRVEPSDILGPKRTKHASLARHVVMSIWADYHPYQDAANRCNRGCHSTAMWARERVLNAAGLDKSFAAMVSEISRRCQYAPETIQPECEQEEKAKFLEIKA